MKGIAYYWCAVLGYSAFMVYIGYAIQRGYRGQGVSAFEFWMAKRELPGWWLAASLTAGWLMLGWVGFGMSQVYMYGVTGLWILPVPWFILCLIVVAAVPLVRRIGAVSVPQAMAQRYGPSARALTAVCSFMVFISWTQAELFMAGTLMSPFLGVAPWVCMVVAMAPVIVYTYLGGFRAVVLTDVLQFGLMAIFMLILAGVAVTAAQRASGGQILAALANAAPPLAGKGKALSPWVLGWLFPIVLLVGYLPGWLIEQDLTLRLQAARTTRSARNAAVLGLVLITIFVLVLPSVVAFCALVAFPPEHGAPPALLGPQAYQIVSAFIARLPCWLAGFMLVGIVACQMSTVNTFGQVAAMPLAYDIVDPLLQRGKITPQRRMQWARWLTVVVLLFGLLLAFLSVSLADVYYLSSGVLSASIAVPAFFMFWKRTTLPAALAAAVVGFLGTVGGYWYEYKFLQSADPHGAHYYLNALPALLHGSFMYNYIAAGVLLSTVTILVVSLLTTRPDAARVASVKAAPVDDRREFMRQALPAE